MRLQTFFLFVSLFIICHSLNLHPSPNPPLTRRLETFRIHRISMYFKLYENCSMFSQCLLLTILLIITLSALWYKMIMSIRFICFHTPLNILRKRCQISEIDQCQLFMSVSIIIALLELESYQNFSVMFIFTPHIIFPKLRWKCHTIPRKLLFGIVVLQIFAVSTSQISHILCLAVFLLSCYSIISCLPTWIVALVIILSNDIETQPGPSGYHEKYFSFMCWNLNSLAKDDFSRTKLIESHYSIYDYDIISVRDMSD